MLNKIIIKITLLILISSTFGFSQTVLEKNIQQILNPASSHGNEYIKSYLKGYMQPFATAFGTAVSGAMYHRATVKEFPRFDLGINAVYINMPVESKNFKDSQNNEVPTLFGSKTNPLNNTNLPGGTEINSILVPQFQLNLGLVSSFEITARYMDFNIKEFGDINLLGLGVKYGFGEFIPIYPINFSVQAMYHKFSIGEWLDSGTIGMNLQLSKDLQVLPINFYGGIGFETTTMLMKTDFFPIENILNVGDVSLNGENNYRFNFGLSWTIAIFNLHADYNIGKYNSISFGAMIDL